MIIQFESHQSISKTHKVKNLVLPLALFILSSTVLSGQFVSPIETDTAALKISKGTYLDRIEIYWEGDFSKVWRFSIRKREKYSNGPWRKVNSSLQHLIIDTDVETEVVYQYEVTYIDEQGKIVVLRGYGYKGKKLEHSDFELDISKGRFVDCIRIYLSLLNPLNFGRIRNIRVSRRLHDENDDWIEILDSLKGNILLDDKVAPGVKYDYRIEITDENGNTIELIDFGFRWKPGFDPAISAHITRFISQESILLGWSELSEIEDFHLQVRRVPKDKDLSTCCLDSTANQYIIIDELVRDNFYIVNLPEFNEEKYHYQWRVRGELEKLSTAYTNWIDIRKNEPSEDVIKFRRIPIPQKAKLKKFDLIQFLEKEEYHTDPSDIITVDLKLGEMECRRKKAADYHSIKLKGDKKIMIPLKIKVRKKTIKDTINFYSSQDLLIEQIILLDKDGRILLKESKEKPIPAGCNQLFTAEAVKEINNNKIHCYLGLKDPQSNQNYPVLVKLDFSPPLLLKYYKPIRY